LPRADSAEFEALSLEAFGQVRGFPLHDVWRVELEDAAGCTIPELRRLITARRARGLNPLVRSLFGLRSFLGKVFGLEATPDDGPAREVLERIPARLAEASTIPTGTLDGPFQALYVLPNEAAYQVLNATVHAIIVVALTDNGSSRRLYWATYVKPVGRITSLYMGLIDPFRRWIVYPGLESWLRRAVNRGAVPG
jgi:hypothetical protein